MVITHAGNEEVLDIKVKYIPEQDRRLEKIRKGDWIDLYTAEDVRLNQFEYRVISLGVAMKLPDGYEAHVVPRSSAYKNFGVIQANHFGVIDSSYCGDDDIWHFPAIALRDTFIPKGTRLCQFRIERTMPRVTLTEVSRLDAPSRGGFGSTGTN